MNHDTDPPLRLLSPLERFLSVLGRGMADAANPPLASRPNPAGPPATADEEQNNRSSQAKQAVRHSAGLMRINHVGEVCAQALYEGHALTVRDPELTAFFLEAAAEERDHLAWTRQRLDELQSHPSALLPVWYAGSLALGAAAGLAGRSRALGFMAETERQVEAHLLDHLDRLPEDDQRSRAIVAQMMEDESRHAVQAEIQGATPLPGPIRGAMRLLSRVMTTVAYRI